MNWEKRFTVTIVPFNTTGDATGCNPESFTIVPPPIPDCTSLTTPADGDVDVTVDTTIEWNTSTGADGYKITVTASSSTANNIADFDVTSGNTYTFPNDFETRRNRSGNHSFPIILPEMLVDVLPKVLP